MALKPCKSCKHQVDTKAKTCPNCGVSGPGVTKSQKLLGYIILGVVAFVAVKAFNGSSDKVVSAESAKPVIEKPVVRTLGMTPEQYAERVNSIVAKMGKPYSVGGVEFEVGQVNDSLSANLGPYVSLVGSISKSTGELLELIVLVSGDGTPQSGVEVLLTASAALAATTHEGDPKAVLNKLNSIVDGAPENFGSVKVTYSETKGLAKWFTASPI